MGMTDDELFRAANDLRDRAEAEIAAHRVAIARASGVFAGERLTADEKLVLAWYREARSVHVRGCTGAGSASVLLVGRPNAVGWIDHQLDHIGGGLSSIVDGREVAHCTHFERGPVFEPLRSRVVAVANMLALEDGLLGTEAEPPQRLP